MRETYFVSFERLKYFFMILYYSFFFVARNFIVFAHDTAKCFFSICTYFPLRNIFYFTEIVLITFFFLFIENNLFITPSLYIFNLLIYLPREFPVRWHTWKPRPTSIASNTFNSRRGEEDEGRQDEKKGKMCDRDTIRKSGKGKMKRKRELGANIQAENIFEAKNARARARKRATL